VRGAHKGFEYEAKKGGGAADSVCVCEGSQMSVTVVGDDAGAMTRPVQPDASHNRSVDADAQLCQTMTFAATPPNPYGTLARYCECGSSSWLFTLQLQL
jgi:hypothetical protein